MKSPISPTLNTITAERDKLGDRIQASIESLTADFQKIVELSDALAPFAPDVYGWALAPIALQSALERAFAKAGHPSTRYSTSQRGELRKFNEVVRDGSTAVAQCRKAA